MNAISQSSYNCAETSELNLFHGHARKIIDTTLRLLGTHVIQTETEKHTHKQRERGVGGSF